jgi:hypothetical protein
MGASVIVESSSSMKAAPALNILRASGFAGIFNE